MNEGLYIERADFDGFRERAKSIYAKLCEAWGFKDTQLDHDVYELIEDLAKYGETIEPETCCHADVTF